MDRDDSSGTGERLSALLDSVDLSQYYGPLGVLDRALAEALIALTAGRRDEWNAFADSVTTEQRRRVLGRYTVRAPMLALRSGEPRYLATGLLAYCATHQGVTDWRDDLVAFAPYFHVARALSVDVATLFDDAADYAAPDMAQTMQTFGRRTDVTLGAFGWRQIDTPDGPTFEMLSLRGAPTGAVVGERSWNEVNEAQARALLEWVRRQREQHPGDG